MPQDSQTEGNNFTQKQFHQFLLYSTTINKINVIKSDKLPSIPRIQLSPFQSTYQHMSADITNIQHQIFWGPGGRDVPGAARTVLLQLEMKQEGKNYEDSNNCCDRFGYETALAAVTLA